MSHEPIRVELSEFCQKFSPALNPFATALDGTIQALRKVEDKASVQPILSELQDNLHRLKILRDKADQQHTYLVIFGPLKSGKSTLMNAISGAYVSEVSSLPAYPCLVYVHEGEARGFSTMTFNGDQTHYESSKGLKNTIEQAHQELARRICEAEDAGRNFNPAEDYPEAIRRIDFTLPAPYLKESGTILVDTPGLYTKMKYNYGQLTRDFRNTAACAVFVVKTDNLFYERVFEEFADLLELFPRVFLVVNIDSTKQDLGPDGRLEPALEQENPEKIIETFENLTMSAQIRSAIENGRLRIYMVDLLRTASRSLQAETGETAAEATAGEEKEAVFDEAAGDQSGALEETETEGEGEAPEASEATGDAAGDKASPEGAQIGFDAFLSDLTEYLNSSEYIFEFMANSLRQANSIREEVKKRLESGEARAFRSRIDVLKKDAERAEQQLAEVEALRKNSLKGPLDELSRELHQQVNEHMGSVLPELKEKIQGEIDAWYFSGESLQALLQERVNPRIEEVCQAARKRAVSLVDGVCSGRNGGVRLEGALLERLENLEIGFDDIYGSFEPKLDARFDESLDLPDPTPIQEEIPVRKGVLDWVLFRSPARVRRRIFGETAPSEKPISAVAKGRRLGEEGKSYLYEALTRYVEEAMHQGVESRVDSFLKDYQTFFQNCATERLDEKKKALEQASKGYQENYRRCHESVEQLDRLAQAGDQLRRETEDLYEAHLAGKSGGIVDLDPTEVNANIEEEKQDDEEEEEEEGRNENKEGSAPLNFPSNEKT
ncbi:MAG: GTPase domain-containing protein [Opitutales bacterium]